MNSIDTQFPVSADALQNLRTRLARAAEQEGLLDVAYRTVDSPVGTLLLATTPVGLVRIAYEREDFDTILDTIAAKVSPRILDAPARLDQPARQLDEYFAGRRRAFELPLDYAMSAGFRQAVQQVLPSIAYGLTASYRDIAEKVGNSKAVRAVGTACATNPLPVVVPCHRVLKSDGTLGGYVGGAEAKTTLLTLEGAA